MRLIGLRCPHVWWWQETTRRPVDKDSEEALLFLARYNVVSGIGIVEFALPASAIRAPGQPQDLGKQCANGPEAQNRFYDKAEKCLDSLSETHSAKKVCAQVCDLACLMCVFGSKANWHNDHTAASQDVESIRRELQSLRGL